MTARRAIIVLAIALAAACADDPGTEAAPTPPAAPTTVTAQPTVPEAHESGSDLIAGTARNWVQFETFEESQPAPVAPPGQLTLDSCRWRAPGFYSFDLTWTPAADVAFPVELDLSLSLFQGDMGSGAGGVATIDAEGSFSVPLEAPRVVGDRGRWRASAYDYVSEVSVTCAAEIASEPPRDSENADLTVDPLNRGGGSDRPDPSSYEAVAYGVDFTADDPMTALAYLLAHEDLPLPDRLYLAPELTLGNIEIRQTGTCTQIESRYGNVDDSAGVGLLQRRGCPDLDIRRLDALVQIEDPAWEVLVVGARGEVDALLEQLELRWSDRVPPLADETAFDAESFLEDELEGWGEEYARFEWEGGLIALVGAEDMAGSLGFEPVSALPVPFNAGGVVRPCEAYGAGEYFSGRRGFIAVVTNRADLDVIVETADGAIDLDLVAQESGLRAGLLPLSKPVGLDAVKITSGGDPIECVQ